MTTNTTCTICGLPFKITPILKGVITKLNIQEPTLCSKCSNQRRLAFRKDFVYHNGTSALSGKPLITVYHPSLPYKVCTTEEWFSDAYNPLDYGVDVDFSRPFFDQFHELSKRIPHMAMSVINCQNCAYNHNGVDARNCYHSARFQGEDLYYCYLAHMSKDCYDCFNVSSTELCYECIDCQKCYGCRWCNYCKNSSNLSFCYDCIGSTDCFGCVGLRNAKYVWFNEQLSESEYKERLSNADTSARSTVEKMKRKLADLRSTASTRTDCNLNSENISGDYIVNSRNIENSYDIEECEDVSDTWGAEFSKDVARCDFIYYGEKTYENMSNSRSQNIAFSYCVFNSHDVEYCMLVYAGSHDVFGSIGLKKNSYVILNKQYSQEDYRHLRAKIIDHMKRTPCKDPHMISGSVGSGHRSGDPAGICVSEYGQFFPPSMSLFPYNETYAQIYFPETKESALSKGFIWIDESTEIPRIEKLIPSERLPDSLPDIPDDVLNWAITCQKCKKPFRIIQKELNFYRKFMIPVPVLCPDERYEHRIKARNPRNYKKEKE